MPEEEERVDNKVKEVVLLKAYEDCPVDQCTINIVEAKHEVKQLAEEVSSRQSRTGTGWPSR